VVGRVGWGMGTAVLYLCNLGGREEGGDMEGMVGIHIKEPEPDHNNSRANFNKRGGVRYGLLYCIAPGK